MERSGPASAAHCIARSITAGASAWPNEIVSLLRIPPQCPHGGSDSPERTRSSVACIGPFQPQERHTTVCTVPCTSITRSGELPAFWCSPSMFWVMSAWSLPRRSSSTIAAWPAFGRAVHAGCARRARQDWRQKQPPPRQEGHKLREHRPYSEQQATEHLTGLKGPADVVEGKAIPDARITRPEGDPVRREGQGGDHQGCDQRPRSDEASGQRKERSAEGERHSHRQRREFPGGEHVRLERKLIDAQRDDAHAHCAHRDTDRDAPARRRIFFGHAAPFLSSHAI